MGAAVSPSHISSPSMGWLLTLFPYYSIGFLQCETVLYELLQCASFSGAEVLNELLQHGSLPQGAVLQECITPAWFTCGILCPTSKPSPMWSSLHECFQELAPVQAVHSITSYFGCPLAPGWHPLWAVGELLPHHDLHHRLQRNLFSGAWNTSSLLH